MDLGLVFGMLKPLIGLLELKEQNKYEDKRLSLEKQYYEEKAKPESDDSVLDYIRFELNSLCRGTLAAIAGQTPKNK